MNFFLRAFLAITVLVVFQFRTEASQSKTLCSIEEPRIKALYDSCDPLPKDLILLIAMYEDENLWRHKARVCSMTELANGTVAIGLENGVIEIRALHYVPEPPYGILKIGAGHAGPVTLLSQTSTGTLLSGSTLNRRPIAKMDINGQKLTYYSFDQVSPSATDFDERIHEWDLKTGAQVRALAPTLRSSFPLREDNTLGLSKYFCKLSGRKFSPLWIRSFSLSNGKHIEEDLLEVQWDRKLHAFCCAEIETEKFQILGCKNGQIYVWNKIKNENFILYWHVGAITVLKLDKTEKYLVSGSEDWTIRVWSLEARKGIRLINAHKAPIRALAILSTGKLISSSGDKSLIHELAVVDDNSKLLKSKL